MQLEHWHGTSLGLDLQAGGPSMRDFLQCCGRFLWFYGRVFFLAFLGSLTIASTLSLVVFGLALPIVIWKVGEPAGLSPGNTFRLAWGLFVSVFGIRLILAPFWIHELDTAELKTLKSKLADDQKRSDALNALAAALSEGMQLYGNRDSLDQAKVVQWIDKTRAMIEQNLGPAEATLFVSNAGYSFVGGTDQEKNWIKVAIEGRTRRLQSIIERFNSIWPKPFAH